VHGGDEALEDVTQLGGDLIVEQGHEWQYSPGLL
jgi:hypothetical protein